MEKFKKVLHNSFFYRIFLWILRFWFFVVYYKEVKILGRESIPADSPVIFNPNHPNSFIDDVSILSTNNRNTVIVGHAGLFKNSLITRILIFFRLIPAFRKEDGKENLYKNQEVFDLGVYVLKHSFALLIFPEARHTGLNHLFPIRKGAIRIAFKYAQEHNFISPVYMVPVGLYYSDFSRYRSKILINYGKAVNISDFARLYKIDPAQAINKVRQILDKRIKSNMLHIPDQDDYDFFDFMRQVADDFVAGQRGKSINDVKDEFEIHKFIIDVLYKLKRVDIRAYNKLKKLSDRYMQAIRSLGIKDTAIEKRFSTGRLVVKTFEAFVFLPVYLLLALNFSVPVILTEFIAALFPQRPDKASVRFVAPMVFVPLWVAVQLFILWKKVNYWWLKVFYAIIHPWLFIILCELNIWLGNVLIQWKIFLKKDKIKDLILMRDQLIKTFSEVWKENELEKNLEYASF